MDENVEFEFPDESELKTRVGSKVVEPAADDEPEIEVVDDTPEDDRGREPMKSTEKQQTSCASRVSTGGHNDAAKGRRSQDQCDCA